MNIIFFIVGLFFAVSVSGQGTETNKPGYFVFAFGGQSMISVHYDGMVINNDFTRMSVRIGGGLNQNGDDAYGEYAVYCLMPELLGIFGMRLIQLETGLSPTVYFHHGTSFTNLNGMLGLRIGNAKKQDYYLGIDYTPRLYTTSSNSAIQRFDFALRFGAQIK